MAEIRRKFGLTILNLRLKSEEKLTQADIADYAGISLRYYSDLEKGIKNPTLEVMNEIAKAHDLKLWELLRYVENIY
ncbi:MAG: helix-turn-helix domain-containing protein [Paludibacteraceae bacterium]|nr:helix-turn-helix domain-containing protein [Paludibacteraceae bacterium]